MEARVGLWQNEVGMVILVIIQWFGCGCDVGGLDTVRVDIFVCGNFCVLMILIICDIEIFALSILCLMLLI